MIASAYASALSFCSFAFTYIADASANNFSQVHGSFCVAYFSIFNTMIYTIIMFRCMEFPSTIISKQFWSNSGAILK